MGMHLNYELRLPGSTSADDVAEMVTRLRDIASTIPFRKVSPIYQMALLPSEMTDPLMRHFHVAASVMASPNSEEDAVWAGVLATAAGFVIHPGLRCEGAAIGFVHRIERNGQRAEWFWHWCCKTQYASVISDEHLIACHVGLVRFLDAAAAIGVDVVVRDEGHYWETRDEARLLAEVRAMNQLVARIVGRLSDGMGPVPGLGAPIFAHRDFERLEMGE